MKDRLLTLALAIGALAAFYVLLAPKPAAPQQRVTRPLSTEAGPNGYLALQRWLAAEQVPTLSLRERYGRLPDVSAAAPTGNLLITTTPHVYPLRNSESQPLSEWIASGNTLLVLAGLSDTPEWSLGEGRDPELMEHMKLMTGLSFVEIPAAEAVPETSGGDRPASSGAEQPDSEDSDAQPAPPATPASALSAMRRLVEPQRFESSANGAHPLLEGVQSIITVSEYPSARWRATSESGVLLELMGDHTSGMPALWLLPHGDGQIIVSAFGNIFTNKIMGEHDNARLLANLTRWSLSPRGQVIIDDAHQGLVSFYDPDKFFGDSRLHRSLWWLFALWLVFVLGPRRLRPTVRSWNPIDVTSFVRATGGFMARVLQPAAAGQRLFANFFNELRHRLGLAPDGTPVWDWLAAHATIPATDLGRLQELHRRVAQRRRINLPELHNLLVRIRALLN